MNRTLPLLLALFPLLAGCQPSGRVSNLVALFTDFGSSDPYVAQLKGAIKTISPSAEIMDLSHENGAFDILSASYLLAKSARTLPPGTIIVAVVDPGVGSNRAALAVRTQAGHNPHRPATPAAIPSTASAKPSAGQPGAGQNKTNVSAASPASFSPARQRWAGVWIGDVRLSIGVRVHLAPPGLPWRL